MYQYDVKVSMDDYDLNRRTARLAVVHIFDPSTWEMEAGEFARVSPRTGRDTQKNCLEKKKPKTYISLTQPDYQKQIGLSGKLLPLNRPCLVNLLLCNNIDK